MLERTSAEAEEGVVQPTSVSGEEQKLDETLRPSALSEFVGQRELKETLHVFLEAAKSRQEPLEHVLLYGNPGLGKTTLAHVIGNEMGAQVRVTSGPALERVGDLAAILSNLGRGDILFIDEIHRLNKLVEEVLYPAMEDYVLDIIVGKGPTARTLRLNLERFTLIGATTRLSLLSAPLRDRFGSTFHLNFYETDELKEMLRRNTRILNVETHPDALEEIAQRSRRTPRIANRLLKRLRDFAQVRGDGTISRDLSLSAMSTLAIDPLGLDATDRRLLSTLIEKFDGGPVGLNTLSAATQEEMETIEEVYEPYLLQIGFLERTPRGRCATSHAYRHLGFSPPTLSL